MARTANTNLFGWLGWNCQGDLGPYTFYTSARKKLVFFLKAPPLLPPTGPQIAMRNQFRLAMHAWRMLTEQQRHDWERASKAAHLGITGLNLFVFTATRQDPSIATTVSHQTRIPLQLP